MAIRFINYTKEQRSNCDVTGYSLYVESNYICVCDRMIDITNEAKRYPPCNDIEIYQVLKRRR